MNRLLFVFQAVLLLITLLPAKSQAANFYWVATSQGNWSNAANWGASQTGQGGLGVPGASDKVIFTGYRQGDCVVDTTAKIQSMTVLPQFTGDFTLNDELAVEGTWASSTNAKFLGTGTFYNGNGNGHIYVNKVYIFQIWQQVFEVPIGWKAGAASCNKLNLNGGVFHAPSDFSAGQGAGSICNGNNVFHDEVTIRQFSAGTLTMANNVGDTYHSRATFIANAGALVIAEKGVNVFHDDVYISNTGTPSNSNVFVARNSQTTFKGNIYLSQTLDRDISFGNSTNSGVTVTLESGQVLEDTTVGFDNGKIVFKNFTQGSAQYPTDQVLSFTNQLETFPPCEFYGNVAATLQQMTITGTTFHQNVNLTRNSNIGVSGQGGNVVHGDLSLHVFGSAIFYFSDLDPDTIYGDVSLVSDASAALRFGDAGVDVRGDLKLTRNSSGSIRLAEIWGGFTTLGGDLIIENHNSSGIYIGSTTGRMILDGIHDQSVQYGQGYTLEIGKLTVDKPSGRAIFQCPVIIKTNLNLTNGIVEVAPAYSLCIDYSTTAVSGSPSDTSFIDGSVKKIGDDAFTFPIGANERMVPIGISAPSSSTDAFVARFVPNAQTKGDSLEVGLSGLSECDHWVLNRSIGTSDVYVTLDWNSSQCQPLVDFANVTVARWDTDHWADQHRGAITGTSKKGSITALDLQDVFGVFTYGKVGNNPIAGDYGTAVKKLDAGYHVVQDALLGVKYTEEYNDQDKQLTYKIYNHLNEVVVSDADQTVPVAYGPNYLTFDISGSGFCLNQGYYILEIINEKNEKWYLRFYQRSNFNCAAQQGGGGS